MSAPNPKTFEEWVKHWHREPLRSGERAALQVALEAGQRAALQVAFEAGQKSAYDLQHAAFTAPDLSFAELRAVNVKRCEESFFALGKLTPLEWSACIAEEAGEFCGVMKKMNRARLNPNVPTTLTLEDAADELADIITYVDLAAAAIGVDLASAVRRKFNVVSERVKSGVRL